MIARIRFPLLKIGASALCLTMGTVATSSCGSDIDEENIGNFTDADGNTFKITRMGQYYYNYDAQGRLTSFSNGEDQYNFDKDMNIVANYSGIEYADIKVSYNSKGYIVKLTGKSDYDDEDEQGTLKVTMNISYSGNHLTSIKTEYRDEWRDEDGKHYEEENTTTKLTWQNDQLTEYQTEEQHKHDDGENHTDKTSCVFAYNKTDAVNPLQQPFLAMFEQIQEFEEFLEPLGLIGLFGSGPAIFPTAYECYDIISETQHGARLGRALSYDLNSNGTINTEYIGGVRYGYSYTSHDARSLMQPAQSGKRYVITPLHRRKR